MNVKSRAFATVILGMLFTAAWADNKPKNRQEERNEEARERAAREQVQAAQEKLQAAGRELRTAQEEFNRARSQLKSASDRATDVRTELEQKHDRSSGVTRTRESYRVRQADFERAREPVLATLRQRPDYASAKEAAEAARSTMATVSKDSALDPEQKSQRLKELGNAMLVPGQLERAAIDAAAEAKAAKERMALAATAVQTAVDELERLIGDDPAMRKARQAVSESAKSLETAKQHVEHEQQQVAAAGKRLAQEQAQLRDLQARERRDDAKDKQPKKDKKK